MPPQGTTEWVASCKDCLAEFRYSHHHLQANRVRGLSHPERCPDCQRQYQKEIFTVGQPSFRLKPLLARIDPDELETSLGRLHHSTLLHRAEFVIPPGEPPNKFGIRDDKIVEMFRWFQQAPSLQVVVVVGPTGSGKSTYFPYRLVYPPRGYVPAEPDPHAGVHFDASDIQPDLFHRYGQIVVTQPRVQATRNIPGYIAKAMLGSSLGAGFDIGYQYAKNPASDWRTKLRFCTDGSLINWIASGQLSKINTVMIDEAHERSLNIDLIIGLLTKALPRYPRLKLIIASATISADLFIDHFRRHLPKTVDVEKIRLGDATREHRRLTTVTERQVVAMPTQLPGSSQPGPAVEQSWWIKPADNCELMEFEGKSFRVAPHFHDGPPLDYAYLDPDSSDESELEAAERRIKQLARSAPEEIAAKAMDLLKLMYLSPDELRAGQGLKRTRSLDAQGRVPAEEAQGTLTVVDVTERRGDILGFLHGERWIQACCQSLREQSRALKAELASQGIWFQLEALPLYTQLAQSEQDKALLERKPALHEKLVNRILAQIEQGSRSILAVHDNVEQFEGIQKLLQKEAAAHPPVDFQFWTAKSAVDTSQSPCLRKADAQIKPAPAGAARVVLASSRALAVWDVPYAEAADGAEVILAGDRFTFLPQDREVRRVIISTNVAETSLTIHGILHVIDSGVINQSKWVPETQTKVVRPILQSRAGCKQRWGRAGRLQAGDAWLLYTRDQFGLDEEQNQPLGAPGDPRCFPYYSQPEIRRSPLEQVLLTAKRAGLESLDPKHFPWLESPSERELDRAQASLKAKGALDANGRLTAYGLELAAFQTEPRLANLMVLADRMTCAVEMATVLAILRVGYRKLFVRDVTWPDATAQQVESVHAALTSSCADDLEAGLKVIASVELAQSAGQALAAMLDWQDNWSNLTQRLIGQAQPSPEKSPVQSLIESLAQVQNQADLEKARPLLGTPLHDVFMEVRPEARKGLERRLAWKELEPHWKAISLMPGFARSWREAATSETRLAWVSLEVLEIALKAADLDEFLLKLGAIEARENNLEPAPVQSPAPDEQPIVTEDQAQSRQETAAKFLLDLKARTTGLGRHLPERPTPLPDSGASTAVTWATLDALTREFVKSLGSSFQNVLPGSVAARFIDSLEKVRMLAEIRQLQSEATPLFPWITGGESAQLTREAVQRLRAAIPNAAAQAWCAANFVDFEAISGKDKITDGRNELVNSLACHKKEEERRPLNFALLDRLRLIFAHAMPEYCYSAKETSYAKVLPGPPEYAAVIQEQSICALRRPAMVVCAERRPLAKDASGQRQLELSFVLSLDRPGFKIEAAMLLGNESRKALGEWNPFELAAFLPETAPEEALRQTNVARSRMLLDQRFPLYSEWMFQLEKPAGENVWSASGMLQQLRPPIREQPGPREESEGGDEGGDFTVSTFADERPEPVLAPDSTATDPEKRPLFVADGQSLETALSDQVNDCDQERTQAVWEETESAEAFLPSVPPAPPLFDGATLLRFASPPLAPESPGAQVRGWILGFDFEEPTPVVIVGRRDPRDWLRELAEGQTVNVELLGRSAGATPAIKARVRNTEIEVPLTAGDLGFRDDSAVIETFLAMRAAGKDQLCFPACVWEVAPDELRLRLTTFPGVMEWCRQNVEDPTKALEAIVVRSNPTKPQEVGLIVHANPAEGLVIVAEGSPNQFGTCASGSKVLICLARSHTRGRWPEVKRRLPGQVKGRAEPLGVKAAGRDRTRYVAGEPMSLQRRAELLALAPADLELRAMVDGLFKQSHDLFATEAATANVAITVGTEMMREIIARVIEVNTGGVRLKPLDDDLPIAWMKLWMPKDDFGANPNDPFALGQLAIVRPVGRRAVAGELRVTARPPDGCFVTGTVVEIDARSGARVSLAQEGLSAFCPSDDLYLGDASSCGQAIPIGTTLPFLTYSERNHDAGTLLSHRMAAWTALMGKNGSRYRGVIRAVRAGADEVDVDFGGSFLVPCAISHLGIGDGFEDSHLQDLQRLLEQGAVVADFSVVDWRLGEFRISARPWLYGYVDSKLWGQTISGTILPSHPDSESVPVRIAPFIVGLCRPANFGPDCRTAADLSGEFAPGQTVAVRLRSIQEDGTIFLERLSRASGPLVSVGRAPPRGRDNLPTLLEQAWPAFGAQLTSVEQLLRQGDLKATEEAVKSLRADFSFALNVAEHLIKRLTLLRDLHDRFVKKGKFDEARLCWPMSPHVPPGPPSKPHAEFKDHAVFLAWGRSIANGSVRYCVDRDDQKIADDLQDCVYRDDQPLLGARATYVIRAVAGDKETSSIPVVLVAPAEVDQLRVRASEGQVDLEWKLPPAADGVEVWRKLAKAPDARHEGQLIARGKISQFRDIGLPIEKLFGYRVVALFGEVASVGVTTVIGLLTPVKATAALAQDNILLSWNSCSHTLPVKYRVWRLAPSPVLLADGLRECQFTDAQAPSGIELSYKIEAYSGASNSSGTTAAVVRPAEVTDLRLVEDDATILLFWVKPPAATGVAVWRKKHLPDGRSSRWTRVRSPLPTSLRDEGLVNDVAVTYRVVAVYPHAAAQGVLVAGIPFCPPKPCAWSVENQSGPALTVSWAQPERGEAKLLLSETALVEGLHPSEVAQAFGRAIPSSGPGTAAVTLPQPGRWYLTLCVVLRGRAWVSAPRAVIWVEPVQALKLGPYRDGKLAVQWEWAAGNEGALLVFRTDRPPMTAADGTLMNATRTSGATTGTSSISVPEGSVHVAVFARMSPDDLVRLAPGRHSATRLREPCAACFTLTPVKRLLVLPSGEVVFSLMVPKDVKLPGINILLNRERQYAAETARVLQVIPEGTACSREQPYTVKLKLPRRQIPNVGVAVASLPDELNWFSLDQVAGKHAGRVELMLATMVLLNGTITALVKSFFIALLIASVGWLMVGNFWAIALASFKVVFLIYESICLIAAIIVGFASMSDR